MTMFPDQPHDQPLDPRDIRVSDLLDIVDDIRDSLERIEAIIGTTPAHHPRHARRRWPHLCSRTRRPRPEVIP